MPQLRHIIYNKTEKGKKTLAKEKVYQAKAFSELMAEAYDNLGHTCSCCGESEKEFLTIEHILSDGRQHKREVGFSMFAVIKDIKRQNWDKTKYTMLCLNCNKATYMGVCPHKDEGAETILPLA